MADIIRISSRLRDRRESRTHANFRRWVMSIKGLRTAAATVADRHRQSMSKQNVADYMRCVISDTSVVFAVWPDSSSLSGVDVCLIKGRHKVEQVTEAGQISVDALPFASRERAIAARAQFGDGRPATLEQYAAEVIFLNPNNMHGGMQALREKNLKAQHLDGRFDAYSPTVWVLTWGMVSDVGEFLDTVRAVIEPLGGEILDYDSVSDAELEEWFARETPTGPPNTDTTP